MKYFCLLLTVNLTLFAAGCGKQTDPANNNAADAGEAAEKIRVVPVPDSIKKKMEARGDQENAEPSILVESPKDGAVIESSTVKVKVKIEGDLKGYAMGKAEDGTGNHVHVILDNQPYAAHYMWDEGFELRNVTDGEHTLRMFPSRPWHQSYKNEQAFKVLKFSVKNGAADESKPTTDANGTKLADPKEGADMAASQAGAVDFSKPLLTYSRPKGEYKGDGAEAIMIDFWLSNAKLTGDGGEYLVNYSINGGPTETIEKWEPVWLSGWKRGKNTVRLWLVGKDGKKVANGGYNETTREITVD
ncbi:MAG: hypothetical protein OEM82_05115 [Acidobacteriota bacterium]|nr:hypothetical protein [Acidobacteriota bacterium]MDH3528289.1 hypothetical protein [Acidobacteriota bacterium]